MTTITKCCDICTDDKPKRTFVFCKKCLNDICYDCSLEIKNTLKKCPMCRAEPYKTTSLATDEVEQKKPEGIDFEQLSRSFNYSISNFSIYFDKCKCRSKCQHKRCDCVFHNEKFEHRQLIRLQAMFNKFYREHWKNLSPSDQHFLVCKMRNNHYYVEEQQQLLDYNPNFNTNIHLWKDVADRLEKMI